MNNEIFHIARIVKAAAHGLGQSGIMETINPKQG